MELTLTYHAGTLVVEAAERAQTESLTLVDACVFDERTRSWRAPAAAYREVFADLHVRQARGELQLVDQARAYGEVGCVLRSTRKPRPYQSEAVAAWQRDGRRGQVVLPTGAGKSYVAHLAIAAVDRSTLVVVPTLDLMGQWYDGLLAAFDIDEVGLVGGGYHEVMPLTVTTYDSFHIHIPRYGDRFGLIVFDEVHHLGGETYLQACDAALAPFRLGLTATPDREDGRDEAIARATGPIVYRKEISDMAGEFLADYDVERLAVHLTDDEQADYDDARAVYLDFVRAAGIRFGGRHGWSDFVIRSSRSRAGRRAMRAYQTQRRIALTCARKVRLVERLIAKHAADRVIVFTNDNHTVYELSRHLLLPVITHQTPTRERREVLSRFNDGTYPVILTSKVLNEGVDVPAANVAIVLSGSGSVREHVQRLGRILRKREGKRALLYELVTRDTVEERVSDRRREHDAYR